MAIDNERQPLGDPAVDQALGGGAAADPIYSGLVKRERGKSQAQIRKAARDRKRNKKTYDLPPHITERVHDMAGSLGVPPGHLVGLLLAWGLAAVGTGELKPEDYTILANHPRYSRYIKDLQEEF